jgi:TfoX/Sxy family transcriptional regulator of competence genes
MVFDEKLAERVRKLLPHSKIEEKKMMGGLTFMVNSKMCVGVLKDELMVRFDPAMHETIVNQKGARPMDFTKRPMRGFVFVGFKGTKTKEDLDYWIKLALEFNKKAKATKKRS